jgi:glycosyltransferase involved in cell wall biosynthesis
MSGIRNPLVSVVTPFYNTEAYLKECIESVLGQTYQNWEYILVNNCSTDGSRDVAASYASRDSRIQLVDNTRLLPQVQNYNGALRRISGECKYCKIVQADDWIYPGCLSKMVAAGERDPSAGIIGAYYQAGDRGINKGPPENMRLIKGSEMVRKHLLGEWYGLGTPSTVLFRSEIVRRRDPFYSEGSLHEDIEACYEILLSWDFGYVHDKLSYIRVDNESITSSASSFNWRLLDRLIALRKYGLLVFPGDEFREAYREVKWEYNKFLGKMAVLRLCDKAFWTYHKRGLASIGWRLGPMLILKCIFLALVGIALNKLRLLDSKAS